MAEFRKLFYALGAAALLAGVSTSAKAQGISCSSNSSVPTVVRAESFADLVGDFVLDCTGGVPTTAGSIVPSVNITISLSTNITSKVLNTSTVGGNPFSEALLIIDEPNVGPRSTRSLLACGDAAGAPYNPNGLGVCQIIAPAQVITGTTPPVANSANTYDGTANGYNNVIANNFCIGSGLADPDDIGGSNGPGTATPALNSFGCGRPNVFQGRKGLPQNSGNTNIIVFNGVPFDPPGQIPAGVDNPLLGHRILRITNIRANSPQVAGGFLLAEITASVNITGVAGITIDNPTRRVASVQIGLQALSVAPFNTFVQCQADAKVTNVRFREGFANSFKAKGLEMSIANGLTTNVRRYNGLNVYDPVIANQNVPGINYFTESGFVSTSGGVNPTPNPPTGLSNNLNSTGNGVLSNTTGINTAGVATQGTRLAVTFTNVPLGMSMAAPNVVNLVEQNTGNVTGVAVRTTFSSLRGDGPFSRFSTSTNSAIVNNDLVVYEVLFADPDVQEDMTIPVTVTPVVNLASDLPEVNKTAQVSGGFAPSIAASDDPAVWGRAATNTNNNPTVGGGVLPVPRFRSGSAPVDAFRVLKCACNLLFPFVTNAPTDRGNFDTGIALVNASLTPGASSNSSQRFGFSNTSQSGPVQFWFYPVNASDPPVATKCTNVASPDTCPSPTTGASSVQAGETLLYVLSQNNARWGLKSAPGFNGYMIAQASFQYCHAFAYISAQGNGPLDNGMSVGYLALQLDNNVNATNGLPARTSLQSESLAH